MSKFNVGDRVKREIDIYNLNKEYKFGTIKRIYSKPYDKNTNLGPYPELYSVIWNDGSFEKGFLPHGLTLVMSNT